MTLNESHEEKPKRFPRRRFIVGVIGSVFGFFLAGAQLIRPESAQASVPCQTGVGRIYCKMDYVVGAGSVRRCHHTCYDTWTLQFCYSFFTEC